jgi:hypothetical protein
MGGPDTLLWVRADSVGSPEPLVQGEGNLVPGTWTPDGRQLIYYPVGANLPRATFVYDVTTKRAAALVRSAGSTMAGGVDISRDGRWIAYQSNESGDFQVYVQAYPTGVPRLQISTDGGISPVWRGDGKELFYVKPNADWNRSAGNVRIMAVSIGVQPGLSAGTPKALFSGEYAMNAPARAWDVTPDGQRFLLIREDQQATAGIAQMNIVQNWTEELKRLVPSPERPARK